jgi:hypothetical protein
MRPVFQLGTVAFFSQMCFAFSGFELGAVNGDVTSPEHIFDARGRGIAGRNA